MKNTSMAFRYLFMLTAGVVAFGFLNSLLHKIPQGSTTFQVIAGGVSGLFWVLFVAWLFKWVFSGKQDTPAEDAVVFVPGDGTNDELADTVVQTDPAWANLDSDEFTEQLRAWHAEHNG